MNHVSIPFVDPIQLTFPLDCWQRFRLVSNSLSHPQQARGVRGKFQARREAEVMQWKQMAHILGALSDCDAAADASVKKTK